MFWAIFHRRISLFVIKHILVLKIHADIQRKLGQIFIYNFILGHSPTVKTHHGAHPPMAAVTLAGSKVELSWFTKRGATI